VLAFMRRYVARHGALFALAALSPDGLQALKQAEVTAQYRIMPTLPIAVAVAGLRVRPAERLPAMGGRQHVFMTSGS